MGEALRKACPAIDLKQQVGNLDTRQRVIGCIPEGLCPWWGRKSRSLAFHLHGAHFGEGDLYVMINACRQPLRFHVQEGEVGGWSRIVDTSLPSPEDISEPGSEILLPSLDYEVSPRSVVVLSRRFCET